MDVNIPLAVGIIIGYFLLLYALTSGRKGLRAGLAILKRNMYAYWSYKFAVASIVLRAVLVAVLVLVVGRALLPLFVPLTPENLQGNLNFNYAAFLITAFVAWPLIWNGFNIASRQIRIEQFLGMFEVLMPTAVGVKVLPFAYLALSLVSSILTGIASLFFFHYFFDLPLHLDSPALVASLAAVLAVSMFMAWGLGLVVGGLTVLVREVAPFSNMLRFIMLALSGVIVPVELLPVGIQWVSRVLPLTHAFNSLRNVLLNGNALTQFWPGFLQLLLFSLFTAVLGIWIFEKCVERARRFGTVQGY